MSTKEKKIDWLDLSLPEKPIYDNGHNSYYFYDTSRSGLSTLENLGNTCFFNSVIQCLTHTHPLVKYILKGTYPKTDRLFTEFTRLTKTMWHANYRLTPTSCYNAFSLAFKKNNHDQEDSHEVLLFLLNHFHDVLKYPVVFKDLNSHKLINKSLDSLKGIQMSPINHIFLGQLHQRTQCIECHHMSHTFPIFMDIILPLEEKSEYQSIYHLLSNFCNRETIDNEWNCDACGAKKCSAFKKTTLWRLPQILVITLGRFNHNGGKNHNLIDYPITDLDLTKYITYPEKNKQLYDLYAISAHKGSVNGGHYYSFCKIGTNWVILNDEQVDYINRPDDLVTSAAYILFYQSKTPEL